MVATIGLLGWTIWQLGGALVQPRAVLPSTTKTETHTKRSPIDSSILPPDTSPTSEQLQLHLLIPGLTLPLSDLPVLLLALFGSQLFHEAGHALCAALDAVPLHTLGASITVILPAAFVGLPTPPLRAAPRIAAAGALHNLVLYGLLLLPLGHFLWPLIGYENVSARGRAVLSVERDSSLKPHIAPGAVITKLDDAPLVGEVNTWEEYLTLPNTAYRDMGIGWCVDSAWFSGLPDSCCRTAETDDPQSCFTNTTLHRCLDPVALILPSKDPKPYFHSRCTAATSCVGPQTCVGPRADENVIRITVEDYGGRARVVVWRGPTIEVYEEVQVGTIRPRWAWLPLPIWLPWFFTTFIEYMKMLSLSLFLFNLLPLPRLDGAALLHSLLDRWERPGENIDVEDVERGPGLPDRTRISAGKARWMRGAQVVTTGLFGGCILLGGLVWVKNEWR
ncbi:hypothetical protein OF83DRAFT_1175456 [Amylostereum chailletii]|nr:hypothetical protein OF83DRAFT_1175456 [Amylostereum chailletii]